MEKIAIMTDTNCGILPAIAEQYGIFMLKMPFFIDGQEYLEYGTIEYDEFFHRMSSGSEVSTSQPSPGDLCDMWDEILKSYDAIIYLPMSSGLSGTYSTAKMLAEDYDNKIFVVDNKRISVTLSSSVFDALYLRDKGLTALEIVEKLERNGMEASIYIAVNTLEFLKKSGRVTSAGAAIGTLLGIKPVLQIQGEKLDAYKKVRGMPAAVDAIIDGLKNDLENRFKDKNVRIKAAYSGNKEQAEQLLEVIKGNFKNFNIEMDALPISISCHVGPGAFGVGVFETFLEE